MSAFGLKVKELLGAVGKDPAWLHHQTGIASSTISNWINNPKDVQPRPDTVAKVAGALGVDIDELAPAAGYAIRQSIDGDERAQRRADIVNARPRLGKMIDRLPGLSANHEDTVLSMIEAFLSTLDQNQVHP